VILPIIITFYVAFFIGVSIGKEPFEWPEVNILGKILLVAFSPVIYTGYILLMILSAIGEWVNARTQIVFFWTYFFTTKWNNKSQEWCRNLSQRALFSHPKNTWHNRLFRYCVYLVNKRNHHYKEYTHKETGAKIKKPKNNKKCDKSNSAQNA